MKHYLDSSVVLAWLMEGDDSIAPLEGDADVASSRLLWIEVSRVIHRGLQTGRLTPVQATDVRHRFARLAAGIGTIHLDEGVLIRAASTYPIGIRTLDAIHLASAEMWLDTEQPRSLHIWSLDRQMNLCAAQLDFSTPLLDAAS